MTEPVPPTCGGCRWWHRGPRDPNDLTAPPVGQCNGAPPQVVVLPAGPRRLVIQTMYPTVAPDMAACRLFEERAAVAEGGGR